MLIKVKRNKKVITVDVRDEDCKTMPCFTPDETKGVKSCSHRLYRGCPGEEKRWVLKNKQ